MNFILDKSEKKISDDFRPKNIEDIIAFIRSTTDELDNEKYTDSDIEVTPLENIATSPEPVFTQPTLQQQYDDEITTLRPNLLLNNLGIVDLEDDITKRPSTTKAPTANAATKTVKTTTKSTVSPSVKSKQKSFTTSTTMRPKPTTIIDGFVTQKEDNLKNEKIVNNEKTSMVVRFKGDGLDGKVVQIVNING